VEIGCHRIVVEGMRRICSDRTDATQRRLPFIGRPVICDIVGARRMGAKPEAIRLPRHARRLHQFGNSAAGVCRARWEKHRGGAARAGKRRSGQKTWQKR
jgi:hypothetical protein